MTVIVAIVTQIIHGLNGLKENAITKIPEVKTASGSKDNNEDGMNL